MLAALLAVGPLAAQNPADLPRMTGSVELSLVNLDVVVTGKDGKPIHGLTAADFEVVHGGKPVAITNFREEGAPEALPPAGALVTPTPPAPTPAPEAPPAPVPSIGEQPRPKRHVVLFLDRLALPDPKERQEVFDALKGLLRKGLQPGDEAMIVTWQRAIRTVHPFTGDLAKLELALDAAAGAMVRPGEELAEIEKLAADDAWFESTGVGDSTMSRSLDAMQAFQEIKGKMAAMKGLIGMMTGMEGRKALVLVSRRLSRMAGAEFGDRGVDTRNLIDALTEAANAGGVTLHTIYAAAFEAELPSAAGSRNLNPRLNSPSAVSRVQAAWSNEMATLSMLAERTGGVLASSTKEASVFAGQVAEDLGSWYSLGYPAPGGAKVADVSVKVKRPGATVRTRHSVVEKKPEEQMKDRVLANLFRWDQNARLPIAVLVKPATVVKKGKVRTPIEIQIPLGRLVLLPTSRGAKGAVSIFVVSAGPRGEFSDVVRDRREVEVAAADLETAKGSYVTYQIDVDTPTAETKISIGVYDEVGREAGFRVVTRVASEKTRR